MLDANEVENSLYDGGTIGVPHYSSCDYIIQWKDGGSMTILDSHDLARKPVKSAPDDLTEQVIKLARRVEALTPGAYTIHLHKVGDSLQYSVHKTGKIEVA